MPYSPPVYRHPSYAHFKLRVLTQDILTPNWGNHKNHAKNKQTNKDERKTHNMKMYKLN